MYLINFPPCFRLTFPLSQRLLMLNYGIVFLRVIIIIIIIIIIIKSGKSGKRVGDRFQPLDLRSPNDRRCAIVHIS
eukprot:SAG11_NODE_1969_length_3985_cov_2.930777_5_plen_76_part_00